MSSHHHHERHGADVAKVHPALIPYWKRAHTDWRFWIGIILMFAAMIYYMASLDLARRPRPPMTHPTMGNSGR